jgi:hypothetical protein
VPKVVQDKKTEGYWIDLNEWLISGGLEIIHQWAYDYVEEHGAVSSAAEAPLSSAKDELIKTSLSEGMQLVLDLGEEAMNYKLIKRANPNATGTWNEFEFIKVDDIQPVVLTNRAVRAWLAEVRGIRTNDPHLESLLTIRGMLGQSGLTEICEYKNDGVRYVAFANAVALAEIERLKLDLSVQAAAKLKPYNKTAKEILTSVVSNGVLPRNDDDIPF